MDSGEQVARVWIINDFIVVGKVATGSHQAILVQSGGLEGSGNALRAGVVKREDCWIKGIPAVVDDFKDAAYMLRRLSGS